MEIVEGVSKKTLFIHLRIVFLKGELRINSVDWSNEAKSYHNASKLK